MFDHPVKIAFVVDDVEAAVRFYTGILDLRVVARFPSSAGAGEDFVFLKSASIYVELLPRKAMGDAPVGFHHMAFLVDNVDAGLEQLRLRGAKVPGGAFDGGVGGIRLGDFSGPEGVLLRLFTSGRLRQRTASPAVTMADILEPGAVLERVATGFVFTEGPVWHGADQCYYFNDIPAAITYRYNEQKGIEAYRRTNRKSNGMFVDLDGGILACQHAARRLVKHDVAGNENVVADRFDGKRLNSPNDVIIRSDGSIFFTDPPYGLTADFGEPGESELGFCGVYFVDSRRAEVRCVSRIFHRPNGLCLSPDESVLYVNDSEHCLIRAYDVGADGTLSDERMFAEIPAGAPGVPDGMKTDSLGNVWVTGPGGVWIFEANGRAVGVITVPEVASNFCFGGVDAKTLLITATTSVFRLRIRVAGS